MAVHLQLYYSFETQTNGWRHDSNSHQDPVTGFTSPVVAVGI